MCYAGNCNPECDNCKPKYIYCSECNTKGLLVIDHCFKCGYRHSQKDKDQAVDNWKAAHPGSFYSQQ